MKLDRTRSTCIVLVAMLITNAASHAASYFPEGEADLQPDRLEKALLYESRFDTKASADDWTIEGPGDKRSSDGRLTIENDASLPLLTRWRADGERAMSIETYQRVIEDAVRQRRPAMLHAMSDAAGKIVGGHVTVWNNKVVTPPDFYLEYEFRPLSPIGLAIVHFSATGRDGSDVFDPKLAPRLGVFRSYTNGDINCYHISYWANGPTDGRRGTSNLRKNAGFFNIASGPDRATAQLDAPTAPPSSAPTTRRSPRAAKIGVLKRGPKIRFYVDDRFVLGVDDRRVQDTRDADGLKVVARDVDTGEPLGGGRIALRQMAGQIGEYSNFRVYRLTGE